MQPRVTAIVVARNGGDHLTRTLEALAAQTRPPDAVIAVDCGSKDGSSQRFSEARVDHLLTTGEALPFGLAVQTAERAVPEASGDDEWLWLLAQDTAPEPDALATMLDAAEVSPSVAAAGPKLVDWDDRTRIRIMGQSMTPVGTSVPVVADEIDQGQHDGVSDVLGVPPAGMLVRHRVWTATRGFDPALPVVDDGLDFCVRVRLAGNRIVLVPAARVAYAGDGVVGERRTTSWAGRRRTARARRTAQLHRRLAYAPAAAVPLHWLSLLPLALLRSLVLLVRKAPGSIGGELVAALRVAFEGRRLRAARSRLAGSRTVGWGAIAPLRIPFAEVRRARTVRRDAVLASGGPERHDLRFFTGGGLWTIAVLLAVSLAVLAPLLGTAVLTGGGLLPLSSTAGELWNQVGYGWRDIGSGLVGAADPFAAVLAVLGSLTFWQPSFALTLLFFGAIPLAGLGAWFAAARFSRRAGLRSFAAVLWALAPMLLGALAQGRPAAVLAHLLLPWLLFAAFAARRSWSAQAATAILAAAVLACAPSLAPILAIAWLGWLVTSGRSLGHVLTVPIPAIALFAPLVAQQVLAGRPLALLADPGVPLASSAAKGARLALGFATPGAGGWEAFAASLGLPGLAVEIGIPVLLAPLAVFALAALFLRGSVRALGALGVALLGFAGAVAATRIAVVADGPTVVGLWPGAALGVYWLGLVVAAVIGLQALGRRAWVAALATGAAFVVVVAPLALAVPLGQSFIRPTTGENLPAFVVAETATHPRAGTLLITPLADGSLQTRLIRGAGVTLDDESTLDATRTGLTARDRTLARLGGNLASSSGLDAAPGLAALDIRFVVLAPVDAGITSAADASTTGAAATARTRAATALDGNGALSAVGDTDAGRLWAAPGTDVDRVPVAARIPQHPGGMIRPLVSWGLIVVFGLTLLLALPTGGSTERLAEKRMERARRRTVRIDQRAAAKAVRRGASRPGARSRPAGGGADEPDVGAADESGADASVDDDPDAGGRVLASSGRRTGGDHGE